MSNSPIDQPIANEVRPEPPNQTHGSKPRKLWRLWPGVAAAIVLLVGRFLVPVIMPEALLYGLLAGAVGILAVVVWWVFFSRAPWLERLGALALIVLALFVTARFVHVSISGGAMGYLFPVLAVPVMALALVAWATASRNLATATRRIALVAIVLLVCGGFLVLRTGGVSADMDNDFHWRWSKTPEERLLAQGGDEPDTAATTTATSANQVAEWPGFRGAQRDSLARGAQIKTDWSASPPVELWRQPIGPGWSSFAVSGDRIYTQEQRGPDEVVACYNLANGKPVWRHKDPVRFWESNGGPGPRGTPTLSNGRVYALGATGILNVLDAGTGALVWSRNAATDTGAKIPHWGISGSPLVIGDIVVVAASGSLAAYDLATGKPRWSGPAGAASYSSPHLIKIDGVEQILMLDAKGAISVAPADGKVLWQHPWEGIPIVQPNVTADGDVLISVSESSGVRRLDVSQGANGWTAGERWTSEYMNPYFNDFVVHKGHAYGFDWSGLTCINLEDGQRKWKGGKYGHGQIVLLPDQDLLLVISEKGELALVKAAPDGYAELSRSPALKGKTWNHPVLVGNVLLVRNAEEMVAFRMA